MSDVTPRTRDADQQLLDALWDFSDPAASEARFAEAIADAGYSDAACAVLATQRARALGLLERTDEAEAVLEGLDVPVGTEAAARVELERGRLLAAAGRSEEAVVCLALAARAAAAAGSTFVALDALHMLALHDTGHEAEWVEEGLVVLGGVSDPRILRWGVALHNNLGWTLHEAGSAEEALAQFEAALESARRYGTAEQRHIARWAVGRCLRTLGRSEEALALQRELAEAAPGDAYVQEEIRVLTEGALTIEG